jgi:hypothetical protein
MQKNQLLTGLERLMFYQGVLGKRVIVQEFKGFHKYLAVKNFKMFT